MFSIDVIKFYLQARFRVVFSHNIACTSNVSQSIIESLRKDTDLFAFVLRSPPPNLGFNHRNAQRESIFYGVAYAIRKWAIKYVLVQRSDAVFQARNFLTDLRRVYIKHHATSANLMMCPFQLQFTDFYGKFHVDDHCVFGETEAVQQFWTVDRRVYNRMRSYANLPKPHWSRCTFPASEAETGFVWTRFMHITRGHAIPNSTLSLIKGRIIVLDPERFGYLSRRGRSARRLSLPCASHLTTMSYSKMRVAMPYSAFTLCHSSEGIYDCRNVADVANQIKMPDWGCRKSGSSTCA